MNRPLRGTVNLPGSKSESNRALMIAAYGGFPCEASHLSEAHDAVLLKALLERTSVCDGIVDCEDAGTVARFLLTYLSFQPGTWLLTGSLRLCERPLTPLVDALRQLGADIAGDRLPLRIVGRPLQGGRVALDGSQSSQFASSLLMAAPAWEHGLQLDLTGRPVSMPYLEMTLAMMLHFGVRAERNGNTITVAHQAYKPSPFEVAADWSAASYWYEMLALNEGGGELLLKGLKADSLQGDAIIAEWFRAFGIDTVYEPQGARITKPIRALTEQPQGLVFDFTDTPDLFPAVYATCAALGVEAVFRGTDTLAGKESDRIKAMEAEIARVGENGVLHSHGDHRIAMSLAALWPLKGPVELDDPSVVDKSYPGFWKDLDLL